MVIGFRLNWPNFYNNRAGSFMIVYKIFCNKNLKIGLLQIPTFFSKNY